MTVRLFSEIALLPGGWAHDVTVDIAEDGMISAVREATSPGPESQRLDRKILLPALANLHSHTFQRAMAGLTERRGPDGRDSFWTWRSLMYRFLAGLDPDAVEVIAALAFIEMLEAGYASVGEFHYLHHQPDGAVYDDIAEMSARIASAVATTGIGLTLLPVLYSQGGADGRPPAGGQLRFSCDRDRFIKLTDAARKALAPLPCDTRIGVAPHSLRAVVLKDMAMLPEAFGDGPIHIHIAEQTAEVDEIEAAHGARPVELLFDQATVSERWCLIHATHMTVAETQMVAASGAVAGLCPVTEANLGDGVFNGTSYREHNGRLGVGTDSNIRISLVEELRQLEYSQRLSNRQRAVLASSDRSTGRYLFDAALEGGATALNRPTGAIEAGRYADLLTLDADALALAGGHGDALLDLWIFAGGANPISDVWSAGRHNVQNGRHPLRPIIEQQYRKVLCRLLETL